MLDISKEHFGGSEMGLQVANIRGRWTRLETQKDINNEYGVNGKSFTT